MGKKKVAAKRCPVSGCRFQLGAGAGVECAKCKVVHCEEHQYPTDHACKGHAGAKPPTAPGGGGLVVVASSKKDSSDDAKKKSDPAKDEQLLAKLLAATPEELLKELLAFGASSARFESSMLVQALSSDSKAIKSTLFGGAVGNNIVEAATADNMVPKLLEILGAHLGSCRTASLSSSEEKRAVGVANIFGMLLKAAPAADVAALLDRAVEWTQCNSEKLGRACGNEIVRAAALARWPEGADYEGECKPMLVSLCNTALAAAEDDDATRNGVAFAVCGIAAAVGASQCTQDVLDVIVPGLSKPKDTAKVLGVMRIIQQLCKELGSAVTPFITRAKVLPTCIDSVFDKVAANGRGTTKKALVQYMDKADPRAIRLAVPILLNALEESSAWRVKALAIQLIGTLGKRKADQMFRDLPVIVPAVMECVKDTKKQVSEAAAETMDNLGSMITNSETINLMPWLLDALKNPEKGEACLDELMDTTFVNSIDAQSLALIIPVVLRGLREGTAEVKLKATITTGNVCSLVADVHDMRPFYSSLMPELKKLQEHSRPRVREHALKAKESLAEDMSLTRRRSSHDKQNNCMVDIAATQALNAAVESHSFAAKLHPMLLSYVRETAQMFLFDLFEDVDDKMPRALVRKKVVGLVESGILAVISSAGSNDEQAAFASDVADAVVSALWQAQGKSLAATTDNGTTSTEQDYLVYLPSIILAFASRMLLKRTGLYLERGHRYSIVGMNGVGKTTMLNRIAARDINGFPEDVSCYYVQHEIMEEDASLSVIGYMHRDLDDIVTSKKKQKKRSQKDVDEREAQIKNALDEVGFSEELRNKPVTSLSGGWRMRLAIARSMLYNADLFLLDEPTNHLDHTALAWLQNYLISLKETTIVFVSHDYDFVDYVATDIIHLADLKLTYYPCTFKEFQRQRPEIAAALPKKDDSGGSGETMFDLLSKANSDERAAELTADVKPMKFPEGCKLQGVANRGRPIASMTGVHYSYPNTDRYVLDGVDLRVTLNSRVALIGPNGAGKSTLLKLLVGELELDEKQGHQGKLWKHQNLRVAYIAQHAMHHLEDSIEMTPCEYIQKRFWEGQDREASKMITTKLTPEDEAKMRETGEICEILSRVNRGKKLFYEIQKAGREDSHGRDKEFKSLDDLERLAKDRPHIIKLVRLFDEKLKMADAGVDLRPLTTPELIKHLEDFGISSEIAQRKIRWMSGGQKSRLVLAAAMWTRPHLIIGDEMSNYIDQATLAALALSLKNFRGGVILISHNQAFLDAVSKEHWYLKDGTVRVESLKNKDEEA